MAYSSKKKTELALYYHMHSLLILEGQLIQHQLEQLEQLNQIATSDFALEEAELKDIHGGYCCINNGGNLHLNRCLNATGGGHDDGNIDPMMLMLPAPPSRSGSPSLFDLNTCVKISSASSSSSSVSLKESKANRRIRFAFDNK